MKILAHRGFWNEQYAKNSLEAIKHALDCGYGFESDKIIFLTPLTEKFLNDNGIQYDAIIYGLPYGERLLVNDKKPSGLPTAVAVNLERDKFELPSVVLDKSL